MKIQYLCCIVRGEALRRFEFLSSDVESLETLNVEYIVKVLALYLFPVNILFLNAMRRGIEKTSGKRKIC